MDYKKSYSLLSAGTICGAIIVFIGLAFGEMIGCMIASLGLAAMLAGIVQALIFCRCPECGTLLKIRGKKPNCCYGCGYKLDL